MKPGAECVVIGGGQVGAETAHFLAQMLRKVTVLEMAGAIAADTVVVAAGYRANNPLGEELKDFGMDVKVVGDAVRARKVMHATREGFDAGRSI